jgi:hypothetical protein
MNFWHRVRTTFARLLLAGWGIFCFAQQVLAQEEEAAPKVKSYGLSYLLVGLMIALGLLLVLRPSLRHKEFRPPAE